MSSVDVVVPCYRYAHFLHECVESVLTQSLRNVRVLIIDDASPDNTGEVAADLMKKDSRVTFAKHTTNKGHINTYNEGIEWASADYMLILSADDYLLPGALRRSVDLMNVHPHVGFTFGKAIPLVEGGTQSQAKSIADVPPRDGWRVLGGLEFLEFSGSANLVSTPTAVVRTDLQKRLGGYCPELPHTGDMEMWMRFAAHASVGILEAHQAVYRRHGANMSLAYMAKGWLPDLEHRKLTFDSFFQRWSQVLPNPEQLRRELLYSLGKDAVGFASAAFNEGEMEVCEQLSAFALSVCPRVERSLVWTKLACKRRMGSKLWRSLRPIAALMGQSTSASD